MRLEPLVWIYCEGGHSVSVLAPFDARITDEANQRNIDKFLTKHNWRYDAGNDYCPDCAEERGITRAATD